MLRGFNIIDCIQRFIAQVIAPVIAREGISCLCTTPSTALRMVFGT
ncbi:MAG: hypothetical protein JWQ49_3375 [Edaphobacter sp.]|nr:hypothetical protein [Edaphobacter sp.]